MNAGRLGWLGAAASVGAVVALIGHIELRLGALAADVTALRKENASLADRLPGVPAPSCPGGPQVVMRTSIDAETIDAIAQAVVQREPQRSVGAAPAASAEPPAYRSVDQEKALSHAGEIVVAAIARGRISRDEVLQMRRDLAASSPSADEVAALRHQIAVAINEQRLKPEDPRLVYP